MGRLEVGQGLCAQSVRRTKVRGVGRADGDAMATRESFWPHWLEGPERCMRGTLVREAGGQPGHIWGRTVARQRRERAEMGLLSRGTAAAGLGAVSAVVRPGPPVVVPNPIPTLPPEAAAPGSSR